jgi:hypothetical protein
MGALSDVSPFIGNCEHVILSVPCMCNAPRKFSEETSEKSKSRKFNVPKFDPFWTQSRSKVGARCVFSPLLIDFFVILSICTRTDSCGAPGAPHCTGNKQYDYGLTDGSESCVYHEGVASYYYCLGLRSSFMATATGSHAFSYSGGITFGSLFDFEVDLTIETTITHVPT